MGITVESPLLRKNKFFLKKSSCGEKYYILIFPVFPKPLGKPRVYFVMLMRPKSPE